MISVSLIIPTYNQRERLEFTLHTIQKQNYDNSKFEVIVINDGSTDSTLQYLSLVEMNNLSIISLDQNKGRAYARNQGIKAAKNDILIFVDSDRILPPDFISRHVYNLRENHVSIGCVAELFEHDINKLFEDYKKQNVEFIKAISRARLFNYYEFISQIYDKNGYSNHPLRWCSLFTGNFGIHKSVFDSVGLFDENFVNWGFENLEFGYRVQKYGYSFILNKKAVNFHLYHNRDRMGEERNNSHAVFLDKYPIAGIEHLPKFLDGEISIEHFQSYMTGKEKETDSKDSFFRKKRFGSKLSSLSDYAGKLDFWNS